MVQRKLDFYWRRNPPAAQRTCTSFLSLPFSVRRRIYVLAGLVRVCPINMNQEGPRSRRLLKKQRDVDTMKSFARLGNYIQWPTRSTFLSDDDLSASEPYACVFQYRTCDGHGPLEGIVTACICLPLPASLLYLSREISEEVLKILYSENSFTVGRSDVWGLTPLQQLSRSALRNIRRLSIRFNSCGCIYGKRMYGGLFEELCPLQGPRKYGLFSCHPDCEESGFHDRPVQLHARQYAIVFDELKCVVTKVAARCNLRLLNLDLICDTKDMATAQEVASHLLPLRNLRSVAIRLSQNPNWHHSMLCQELVRQLTSQELGNNKTWQLPPPRSYRLPVEVITLILEYSELVAPFDLEWCKYRGLAPFDCCTTCTLASDSCACAAYHGASSPTCTCWRLPLNIFLVSHQVHKIAQTIFYRRNHFVLLPKGGRLDDLHLCREPFPDVADMLESLPPVATSLICSLGIVISLPSTNREDAHEKWDSIVSQIKTRVNTRNLRLTLYMNFYTVIDAYFPLQETHRSFAMRLKELSPLKDVCIYSQWPFGSWSGGRGEWDIDLEREILGSAYKVKRSGKSVDIGAKIWTNERSHFSQLVAPDGRILWPLRTFEPDAYGRSLPPLYTYIHSH